MEKIKFSVMHHSPQMLDTLRGLLEQFTAEHHFEVELIELDWNTARDDLTRVALYQQGPDLSEVGSTWITDLASMDALHPFHPSELPDVLRIENYNPGVWQQIRMFGDHTIWAIPWLEETFVIHYRADIFEDAGIDPAEAFVSHDALDDVAERLSELGVAIPVLLPTSYDKFGILHTIASWVWAAGGRFTSDDGRVMQFGEPNALEGMRKFIRLGRHIESNSRAKLFTPEVSRLFRSGEAAITFGSLTQRLPIEEIAPQVAQNWRAAVLPGPHFIGGAHLVMWKHTRHPNAVFELIRFLSRPEIALECAQSSVALPAHRDAQSFAKITNDPIQNIMLDSLRTGRSYRPVKMWGMIETRLIDALIEVENKYLSDPTNDLDELLTDHIVTQANRLNIALAS